MLSWISRPNRPARSSGSNPRRGGTLISRIGIVLLAILGAEVASADPQLPVDAESVISRARAFYGDEADLQGVQTLVFSGTEENVGSNETVEYRAFMMKPQLMRIERHMPDRSEVRGIDEYEGWHLLVDKREGVKADPIVGPLPGRDQRLMRYNAVENLYFLNGYKRIRCQLEYIGKEAFEGREAHVVEFRYDSRHVYRRYFDLETGRLLGMKVGGVTLVEKGQKVVDGIVFPEIVEYWIDGELAGRLVVDSILVNADLERRIFEYPKL